MQPSHEKEAGARLVGQFGSQALVTVGGFGIWLLEDAEQLGPECFGFPLARENSQGGVNVVFWGAHI